MSVLFIVSGALANEYFKSVKNLGAGSQTEEIESKNLCVQTVGKEKYM